MLCIEITSEYYNLSLQNDKNLISTFEINLRTLIEICKHFAVYSKCLHFNAIRGFESEPVAFSEAEQSAIRMQLRQTEITNKYVNAECKTCWNFERVSPSDFPEKSTCTLHNMRFMDRWRGKLEIANMYRKWLSLWVCCLLIYRVLFVSKIWLEHNECFARKWWYILRANQFFAPKIYMVLNLISES